MRDLIERFYAHIWNLWDDAAVADLLDERFIFRGSLGDEATGQKGFRGYRDKIRAEPPPWRSATVLACSRPDGTRCSPDPAGWSLRPGRSSPRSKPPAACPR